MMAGFERRRGIRRILGAIDGSHIPIKAPRENQEVYINRKGFHSIVLQAVCNHEMVFTDCFVGWPGSTHDARVLRRSDLFRNVSEDQQAFFQNNSFLLGVSAYPLCTWLMTPFRDNGHLSESQRNYNFLHSSSRMVIERAFALLKGRFRRLKYVDMDIVADISDMVMASSTLHNICLAAADRLEGLIEDEGEEGDDDFPMNPPT